MAAKDVKFGGDARERMLREMGEALDLLAADVPLVLILEDLHWSDYATLDLIEDAGGHPANRRYGWVHQ